VIDEATRLASVLTRAAAAEIMPRFRKLGADAVRTKTGPLDLVTDADIAAEAAITAELSRLYPDALIVGEEAAEQDPSLLARLADAPLAIGVDPVDGTANFAAGLPLFGTMAAVIRGGETVIAAIHDPVGGDTALAGRGAGAWLLPRQGAATRLSVADPVLAAEMAGNASWRYLPEPERSLVCANLPRVAAAWDYRCAAHQYRMAAAGHCHYLFFNRLMPWDHAPGWLLHREAGGYSAHFDGSGYRAAHLSGGLICAPDAASWQALRRALLER
jgi:fructose-1,6-bisphosphatase/inositol monophosphatase family enzyme